MFQLMYRVNSVLLALVLLASLIFGGMCIQDRWFVKDAGVTTPSANQPGLVAIAEQITANNAKLAKLVDAKAPSVPYYVDDLGIVHQLKKATGYRIDTYGRLFVDVPMDYPFYHLPGGIPEIGSKPNVAYDLTPAKHVSAYPLWDMDK